MNILQAHKYYWRRDGASNYMVDLSAELKNRGNKVVSFTAEQKETLESKYSDYFVEYYDLSSPEKYNLIEKIKIAMNMIYSKEANRNMKDLLKEVDIDIAHFQNIYHHISPSIIPPLKNKDIPVVMTLHDYKLIAPNYTMFHHGEVHEEDCEGWYFNCVKNKCMKGSLAQSMMVTLEMIVHHKLWKIYNEVDKFIAPSDFLKDKCVEYGWDEDKFVSIPNPINADEFEFSDQSGDYICYIGRLTEEKGLDILLDAAAKLPEIPFYITGTGPMEEYLKNRVEQEGLDNITFDGFLTGKALKDRIRNAEIITLPSIWYENYPISVLEAKAMGRLVVGSNIGGIPEQLSDDMLAEPGDGEDLADTLRTWFTASDEKKQSRRKQLRSEVEKVNDPDEHVEKILSIYNSFIN